MSGAVLRSVGLADGLGSPKAVLRAVWVYCLAVDQSARLLRAGAVILQPVAGEGSSEVKIQVHVFLRLGQSVLGRQLPVY